SVSDERVLLLLAEPHPSGGAEPFERPEADLVLHGLRPLDPVAEINIGQTRFLSPTNMIENDIVTKTRTTSMLRVVETVNHRQPVTLPVGQAGTDQATRLAFPRGFSIVNDIAVYRRMFYHVREIALIHLRHTASGMPATEIFAEQFELFAGRPRPALANDEILIGPDRPLLRTGWTKVFGGDANGNTGLAADAARPISDSLA